MTKSHFIGQEEKVTELLRLVHLDVYGPINVIAQGGYVYFVTFTDDLSGYGYMYLMKYKSKIFEKFKEFMTEIENLTGKSIKIIQSDWGGEYLST